MSQIREDAGRWYGEDRSGGWIKVPGRNKKVRVSKLLKNYREVVEEIPSYIMEAAMKGEQKNPRVLRIL